MIFYRGADLDVSLTITDSETGVPVDLTGATVQFRLGQIGGSASVALAMTLDADPTTGKASVTIPAATTLGLVGAQVYTVVVTEGSGRVFIAAQAAVEFTNTVLASA